MNLLWSLNLPYLLMKSISDANETVGIYPKNVVRGVDDRYRLTPSSAHHEI